MILPGHSRGPEKGRQPSCGPALAAKTLTAPVVRRRALHPQVKVSSHKRASSLFKGTLFMDLRCRVKDDEVVEGGREGGRQT